MRTLTIKTILHSAIVTLENIEDFIGKKVEITVREVEDKKAVKKVWKHSGSASLGGALDHVNIRDFAHE